MHKEIFYTNKNIEDTKIVLLSDIHYHNDYNERIFNKIIKKTTNAKPNYICIVGDILDSTNTKKFNKLENFLKNLAAIAPTMVVLGNHDEKRGSIHNWDYHKNLKLIEILQNIDNIHLLNDSSYKKNNINFYGFHMSFQHYEKDNETYESFCNEIKEKNISLSEKTYNITLFHSPINIYTFIKNNPKHNLHKSNLILSGHMHNGCLPHIFANTLNKVFKSTRSIISPTRKIFPKYAQGRVYERDGYIFEGISKLSKSTKIFHILDIFFHKQPVLIIIKKEQ